MNVLVTGATGNVGRPLVEAAKELGLTVRAAVRPGSRGIEGVPSVPLDFADPATFGPALAGIDGLFLLRPPAISRVGPTLNRLVDTGRDTLRHVVFLSVAGAEHNRFVPHASVERHLETSGIPYTFLRAGFFGQNLVTAYRADIREDDRLYLPSRNARVAWVDARDLGEAGARAFVTPDAKGAAWTLKGAESRTFEEVASSLSHHLGRTIRYEEASVPGYLWHLLVRQRLSLGLAVVQTVLHVVLRRGSQAEPDPKLAEILGRAPRTIEDTIRDNLPIWRR